MDFNAAKTAENCFSVNTYNTAVGYLVLDVFTKTMAQEIEIKRDLVLISLYLGQIHHMVDNIL